MPSWTTPYADPPRQLTLADDGLHIAGASPQTHPIQALEDRALRAEIARDFGYIALAEVHMLAALQAHPPPPPTGEACACGVQAIHDHHHLDLFAREQGMGAPVDYFITSARCRACGRLWTFEESGDKRYEYRWYGRPLEATLP